MSEHLITGIGIIVVLGIVSQWIAWRIHVPAILILLISGFIAGPITGIINPEELLGKLLYPVVSISVAIILFEGGLSLRFAELEGRVKVVRNLVSLGVLFTWIIGTLAAYFIIKLDFYLSLLLGAILVVTGPTVIIPIVRHLRLSSRLGSVAKWEGIINDPIGALLAVLVFEIILIKSIGQATTFVLAGILKTVFIVSFLGIIGALIMILFMKKYWIPDYLQNPVMLILLLMVFMGSNMIQPESGLFSVTIMGIIMGNQKSVSIKHIVEFKENLSVLLISFLFIILVANLKIEEFRNCSVNILPFLAVLVFIARPGAVLISTIGSDLTWKERVFLFWMAPRGIVAASVASIFALRLNLEGLDNACYLMSVTFMVIAGTVIFYGLTASPVAKLLKLADPNPQGVLLVGCHEWARSIARCLSSQKLRVIAVDTNRYNIAAARLQGIETYYGSIISEDIIHKINFAGIGRLLALTPNDEINNLSILHFSEVFDRSETYQLSQNKSTGEKIKSDVSINLRGRILFGEKTTYDYISQRIAGGAKIKCTSLTAEFDFSAFQEHYNNDAVPLFLINQDKELIVFSVDKSIEPVSGNILISLVDEKDQKITL
ncbi:cation:proton antiporter [candidate division KSB1 bacterium]